MGLVLAAPAGPPAGRAAFQSLPQGLFRDDPGLGFPSHPGGASPSLVVRSRRHDDGTWLHVINPTAAPGRLVITCAAPEPSVVAVSGRTRLPLQPVAGEPRAVEVDIDAWGMRALWIEGQEAFQDVRIEYDADLRAALAARLARLRERRARLENPVPIDVLDNPSFEIAGGFGGTTPGVNGWELADGRRGAVGRVAGGMSGGQALAFSGSRGLATLRSNPFARPASGRISIAAWLRTTGPGPVPQLRIALEAMHGGQEFYRFAPVGGSGAGRPLTPEWGQYVLQIDDLPRSRLESLRVRFDIMSEGEIEIDDVRVFDLAFDESQRALLTRLLDGIDARLRAGDLGGCAADLEGHWPRYLEAFVALPTPPAGEAVGQAGAASNPSTSEQRTGAAVRLRRWRQ
jgi:hypothetical protein